MRVWRKFGIVLVLLFCPASWATNLTGKFLDPAGREVTGKVLLTLSHPSTDLSFLIVPLRVEYRLVNGALPANARVTGNDVMQPSGTYYEVEVRDEFGRVLQQSNFYINGASFNLGAATPTSITTAQVSYKNPALLDAANTWPAPQSFSAPWASTVPSGTSPFTVTSTTQVANLNSSQLLGATWAAPAAIGGATPAAGTFTVLEGSTSVKINGVVVAGTPSIGQVVTATSATAANWQTSASTGYKIENVNFTPVTSTTTAETVLMSFTLPANELGASQILRLRGSGVVTTGASSVTFRIRAGGLAGTLLGSTGTTVGSSITNAGWNLTLNVISTAAPGASVPTESQGFVIHAGIAPTAFAVANTATISWATNAAQSIVITAQFSAADAANTVTQRQMIAERLN